MLEKAHDIEAILKAAGVRVVVEDSEKSPGFKFADCEMRGVPLRIEIGPRDIADNKCIFVRRDTHEKTEVSLENIAASVAQMLDTIQKDMFEAAKAHLESHTYTATNMDEFTDTINNKPGFIKAMWCGCRECEDKIKDLTAATSRCMPFKQEHISDVCVCCGKPATKMVYWGRAY